MLQSNTIDDAFILGYSKLTLVWRLAIISGSTGVLAKEMYLMEGPGGQHFRKIRYAQYDEGVIFSVTGETTLQTASTSIF